MTNLGLYQQTISFLKEKKKEFSIYGGLLKQGDLSIKIDISEDSSSKHSYFINKRGCTSFWIGNSFEELKKDLETLL